MRTEVVEEPAIGRMILHHREFEKHKPQRGYGNDQRDRRRLHHRIDAAEQFRSEPPDGANDDGIREQVRQEPGMRELRNVNAQVGVRERRLGQKIVQIVLGGVANEHMKTHVA